jgi:hypothetical protein
MKKLKLKLWVKVLVIVLIGALTFFLVQKVITSSKDNSYPEVQINSVTMDSLAPDFEQDSLHITNLTDAGFNIVWITEDIEEGSAMIGVNKATLDGKVLDERISLENRDPKYKVHSIKASQLLPETTYYYKAVDNNTTTIQTFKTLAAPPAYVPISGTIVGKIDEALFLFTLVDSDGNRISTTISTTLLDDNSWLTSIGDMRDLKTGNYAELSGDYSMLVEVYTDIAVYSVEMEVDGLIDSSLELRISDN